MNNSFQLTLNLQRFDCNFAASLDKKVRELYAAVCRLEEEKYDWEARLGRQTEEVGNFFSDLQG
jgi:hypothetical protein